MPRRRAVLGAAATLLVSALVAIAACSGEENQPGAGALGDAAPRSNDGTASDGGATPATIVVELGTGSASFVPLTNADKIAIVRGKQGFQHLWVSIRVSQPLVREAIVTISTRLEDGRPGGPPISVAVLFEPIDGGGGVTEVVGLTGLVDYVVINKKVTVHAEVTTADGQHGADERSVDVLAPIDYHCTANGGGPTCDALCGESHCSTCELGLADVGYINRVDASSAIVTSCTTALDVDAVQVFACCCCR